MWWQLASVQLELEGTTSALRGASVRSGQTLPWPSCGEDASRGCASAAHHHPPLTICDSRIYPISPSDRASSTSSPVLASCTASRPRSALRRERASACACEAASTPRVLLRGAGLAPHLQSQQADLRAIAVCHTQPHPLLIHQTGHALSGLQVSCGWVRRQGLRGACGRAGASASTAAQGWSTALLAHTPCWRTHPAGVAPLRLHGQRFAAAQQGVATKRHHRHPPVPSAGSLRPPLVRGLQGPATRHP